MDEGRWRDLLRAADADAPPRSALTHSASELARRARHAVAARRRVQRRVAGFAAVAASVLLALLSWPHPRPVDAGLRIVAAEPHAAVPSPIVAVEPGDPTMEPVEAPVGAELERQVAMHERLAEAMRVRLVSAEAAPPREAYARRIDPGLRALIERDRAACLLLDEGRKLEQSPGGRVRAAARYRWVIEYFGRSGWADVARDRLTDLGEIPKNAS